MLENIVVIDTGSADLWVRNTGYNPMTSATSEFVEPFAGVDLDGSAIVGNYYKDIINFGDIEIVDFQFAVTDSTGEFGVMGLGNRVQEGSLLEYNNLPFALLAAGAIPRASYSIYLDPGGGSGSLIFGGMDTDKYVGELAVYSVDSDNGDLAINLAAVDFGGNTIAVASPYTLCWGSVFSFLNLDLMAMLDVLFSTTVAIENGVEFRYTSCIQPDSQFLMFDFGENVISVSYADAIIRQPDGTCALGFAYHGNRQILGDVFLRQAYSYFDLTGQKIGLAQASNSVSSNIVSG